MAKRQPDRPKEQGPSGPVRFALAVSGLVLLALAALANYSDEWLFAARGRVFVRLPGMAPNDYVFFPVLLATGGLVLAVLLAGLLWPRFRAALAQPWRAGRTAAPLLAALALMAFSLWPWPSTDSSPVDTGSSTVFYVVTAGAGLALFLAGAWRSLAFLDRPVERLFDRLMAMGRWRFALLVFGFTFLVTNLVSLLVFQHMPHIQDSIAQLFQARIFASGRLWLPSMRFADFFDYTHIINISGETGHPASGFAVENWPGPDGRWYSQYPFLHPLLLVPGVLVGMPWIVNPLLGALTVPAIYLLGRELYDERTARVAALLACLSPFLFNMSAEFMNHTSALLFVTLFLYFYARATGVGAHPAGAWPNALAAGAMLGLVINIRPYTAAALVLPFAAYGVWLAARQPRRFAGRFALVLLAAAAVSSLSLVYNWLTNGHPLLFGYVVKWGAAHEIGFGRAGWGEGHTPLRGLFNTGNDWNMLNKALFEWPLPALGLILLPFAAGTRDRRDWLLGASFLCLSAAYFFYWYHGGVFGPRFLFESATGLLLLVARGGLALPELIRRVFGAGGFGGRKAAALFCRTVPLLVLSMVAVGLPPLFKKYWSYNEVDGRVVRNVRRAGLSNALVFCANLGNGFSANRLDLEGDVVYAKDYRLLNPALTVRYPDRACWYANKDTLIPLGDISYANSLLRATLDELAGGLTDTLLARYKSVIWPFIDLPPATMDEATRSAKLTDFRIVSRELFTGRHALDDYLPALACWIIKDKREHLSIFAYMDDLESFIASDYKFTLLYVSREGTAAVYDVRRVTGDETKFDGKSAPPPLR